MPSNNIHGLSDSRNQPRWERGTAPFPRPDGDGEPPRRNINAAGVLSNNRRDYDAEDRAEYLQIVAQPQSAKDDKQLNDCWIGCDAEDWYRKLTFKMFACCKLPFRMSIWTPIISVLLALWTAFSVHSANWKSWYSALERVNPGASPADITKRADEYTAGETWFFFFIVQLCGFMLITFTIIVHELGHGLTAKFLGGVIEWILIWPMGGICFLREPVIKDEEVISAMDASQHSSSEKTPLKKGHYNWGSGTTSGAAAPKAEKKPKSRGCCGGAPSLNDPTCFSQTKTDLMLKNRWKIILFGPLTHIPQMLFWFGVLQLSLHLSNDPASHPSWLDLLGPFTAATDRGAYFGGLDENRIPYSGATAERAWGTLPIRLALDGVMFNWFLFMMNMFVPMIGWDGGQMLCTFMQLKFRARHRTVARTMMALFPFCAGGLLAFAIWVQSQSGIQAPQKSITWLLVVLFIVTSGAEVFKLWYMDRNDVLEFHPLFMGIYQKGERDVYPSTCGDCFFTCRGRNRGPLTDEERLRAAGATIQVEEVRYDGADGGGDYGGAGGASRRVPEGFGGGAARTQQRTEQSRNQQRPEPTAFSGRGFRLGGD